jgi:purine-binding chemotaxis protein CheW
MSSREYVTFRIGEQLFGLSVTEIRDVFRPARMTPVPLSSLEIAGVLNLRGRIVTAIDARSRLGLPAREKTDKDQSLAIGVEYGGESFGMVIDEIGDVVRLDDAEMEQNPVNLDATWSAVSRGVYRLDNRLLVIMDIDQMLTCAGQGSAAAAA